MLIFAEPMTEELLDATQVAENERAMQELRREMSGQDALTQNTELPSQNATCAVDEVQGDPIPLQIDDEYFVGISSPNSGTLADITVRDLSNGISLPGQTDDVVLKHPPAQSKSSSNDTIMITPQDSTANQSQAAQEVEDAQVEVASLRDFEPEDTKMIRELSMRTSQEQKEYTINAEVQDPTKAVITDLLVKDEHALVDGQEGEAATQDMATRYVGAAAVFTPDDIAANSILPLVASLELYTGIAGSLGQPVYTTPVATLWREILRQALQSPDPLDGIAAKVHITIESFWNHETVFNGISAMKTGFAVASPEDGETYFQLNNAIGLAVKAARKSEFNASLFKAQVELIEQQKLCTPSNLRSLYLDCLLLKTGRQQTALNTYLPLSRLYQASNHVPFQMKVALLGRPELYGVLPVPLTINPSVGAVPILAFCLETSHLIDGKSETGVSDVEYLGPWPLLQTEKSTSEPSCPPKTNKSWNIEYSIRKLDDAEGQRLYTACKERRRRKYESLQETDEWRQQFLNMMSKWSARGRKEKKLAERIFRGTRLKEFRK